MPLKKGQPTKMARLRHVSFTNDAVRFLVRSSFLLLFYEFIHSACFEYSNDTNCIERLVLKEASDDIFEMSNYYLISEKKKKKRVSRCSSNYRDQFFFFVYLMDKWIKKWIIDFFVERSCKLNNKHKCNLYARGYKRA